MKKRAFFGLSGAAALIAALAVVVSACYNPDMSDFDISSMSVSGITSLSWAAAGYTAVNVLTVELRPHAAATGYYARWETSNRNVVAFRRLDVVSPPFIHQDNHIYIPVVGGRAQIGVIARSNDDVADITVAIFDDDDGQGDLVADASGNVLSRSITLTVLASGPGNPGGGSSPVPVTDVLIVGGNPTPQPLPSAAPPIAKGATMPLLAQIVPSNATAELRWESSNPRVATVVPTSPLTAEVKAVNPGRTTITVITADDGERRGRHSVTVMIAGS